MLVCQIHLDFAKMKEENASLMTLKDFLMSSNQAPKTESDIQHLLQAFAEYKQGTTDGQPFLQIPCNQQQGVASLVVQV